MSHDGQDLAEVTAEDDHLATKDVVTARDVAECPLDALDTLRSAIGTSSKMMRTASLMRCA